MPILECILIDASTDVIKLTGNDMELGIETKVEGNILEKGKKYSTLEAAYNAYEKLLTEGEYVKYKDTLPKL